MFLLKNVSLFQAMEQLVDKGLCKAIGISNFTIKKTQALLETARIVPACNQGMLVDFKSEMLVLCNSISNVHRPAVKS